MDPVRSSLRFVVGTALLTAAGVGAACTDKPIVNTVPSNPNPGPAEATPAGPAEATPAEPVEAKPPGPPPADDRLADPPPIINTLPPPESPPSDPNVVVRDPASKPVAKPKKIVNTLPPDIEK